MQTNKIRNEKGDITTDTEEIQRSLCSTKLENVKIIDRFLDKYHIPKLNQER